MSLVVVTMYHLSFSNSIDEPKYNEFQCKSLWDEKEWIINIQIICLFEIQVKRLYATTKFSGKFSGVWNTDDTPKNSEPGWKV